MTTERISDQFTFPSHYADLGGAKMHYIEIGEGDPILFLHGIPTSSYSWRNVIPHLSTLGRCIAPDLMGFGRSDKPNSNYSIVDHMAYMDAFIQKLGLKHITLVMHGWGSIIGFDYAMRHEKNCKGLVFYEAFLHALNSDDISLPYQEQLLAWQDQDNSYDLIANGVGFVDKVLPQILMRPLSEKEMHYYREPFQLEGAGKPLLQYIKELPNGDGNSKVDKIIDAYSAKLTQSYLPKLMLYTLPGFITTMTTIMWAKGHLPNLEISDIGEELHLAQESYPQLIGETISVWLQGIEQMSA
jgi:haloalkane dehalogenase